MHRVTPITIQAHTTGFCSQNRIPDPPIRTIEEGVQIIEQILAKEILCLHDVEAVNRLYHAVDLLEKQVEKIPERNSQSILNKIIEKIGKVASAQDWIYFYHLQNFKELPLKDRFTLLKSGIKTEHHKAIATHLPYCNSKTQFDQDVTALIGPNPTEEVNKILNRKREKFDSYESLKITITRKKKELEDLRKSHPQDYPPYFDNLLDHGYIQLYDHLLHMKTFSTRNDRRSEIEKITFSGLSHIVLQTREAILRAVEKSIPEDKNNILFLLGGSGAGKSTTLCFLRGDRMVLKGFQYESQNDRDELIGAAGATSCTFLPTLEIVNDLVIVDFPGFDDSNGPLVSLGMEFALKALIKKYNPKVLVLEAITNTDGRFAAAAHLGSRLSRLLQNKQACFLGITKYSKDPDFGQLKKIEEDQKNALLNPSSQEIALEAQIKVLLGLNMLALQSQIDEIQRQLTQLQQAKIQKQQLTLPDTDLKKESRARLEEREAELLKQIGLGKIIRFSNLEDPLQLSACLKTLSDSTNRETIRESSKQLLDPDDEKLLEHRFENNLKQDLEKQKDCYIEFKDFKEFEQSVLESSLISTILSQTNPEIGRLLHLPETDPHLVRSYDKKIVGSCIKKYIESIIGEFDISLIHKILEELKGKISKDKLRQLNQKLEKLQKYVLGLLGSLPEHPDKKKTETAWVGIQKEHKATTDAIEKRFELPTWATVLFCIPIGIPYGVRLLYKLSEQSKAEQSYIDNLITASCNDLDQIYDTLVRLKDIEKLIGKQEQLEEALKAVKLSLKSEGDLKKSINDKINKVRSVYGSADWDERIEILKDSHAIYKRELLRVYPSLIICTISSWLDEEMAVVDSGSSCVERLNKQFGNSVLCLYKGVDNVLVLTSKNMLLKVHRSIMKSKETDAPGLLARVWKMQIGVFLPDLSFSTSFITDESIRPKTPLSRTMLAAALLSFRNDIHLFEPPVITTTTSTTTTTMTTARPLEATQAQSIPRQPRKDTEDD